MLKGVFRHSLILILFLSYNGFGQNVNGVISTSENFFFKVSMSVSLTNLKAQYQMETENILSMFRPIESKS